MKNEATAPLELGSIRFDDEGAAEMDGRRKIIFIPRSEITGIDLVYGCAAERPVISFVMALLLLAIAAFSVAWLALAIIKHGVFYGSAIAAVALVIPAVWLIDLSFRKRWYVFIRMRRGTRKLIFKNVSDEVALRNYVMAVRSRYGY